jgi:hypothetical protein
MVTLKEEDEGKVLVDAEGETLGVVTEVENNVAYVDPDPGVAEAVMATFGHADANRDDLTVEGEIVVEVTDEELRLGEDI